MLGIYRRHQKHCSHHTEGRKYRRCRCPVWVDGHLNGVEIHKSLSTRDWQKAQQLVRQWEAEGTHCVEHEEPKPVTLEHAWQSFLDDIEARNLHVSTVRKYRLLSRRMLEFAFRRGTRFLMQFDLATLRDFRKEWQDGPLSSAKKLERLRAFFRFAQDSEWLADNPARKLRGPRPSQRPTLPFPHEEMLRILAGLDQYRTDRLNWEG